jgi:hypothetical protein
VRSGSRSGLIDSPFPVPRGDCAGSSPAGILASSNAGTCPITTKTMLSFSKVEAEFLAHCMETFADSFKEGEEINFTEHDCKTILMNHDQIESLYQKLQTYRLAK